MDSGIWGTASVMERHAESKEEGDGDGVRNGEGNGARITKGGEVEDEDKDGEDEGEDGEDGGEDGQPERRRGQGPRGRQRRRVRQHGGVEAGERVSSPPRPPRPWHSPRTRTRTR